MRIVFIGPPGAGKGTQARRLVQYIGVPHLSTGDILRESIREGGARGEEAERYVSQGQLAPDELVMEIVAERLAMPDCDPGCLFDGFPRNVAQAERLDELLNEKFEPLDLVLEMDVDREEITRRLEGRAVLEQRTDDTPETIRKRLKIYDSQTDPVLKYYQDRGLLTRVDGMGDEDEVFARIRGSVDARKKAG